MFDAEPLQIGFVLLQSADGFVSFHKANIATGAFASTTLAYGRKRSHLLSDFGASDRVSAQKPPPEKTHSTAGTRQQVTVRLPLASWNAGAAAPSRRKG
jgi:hypothetical protein